MQQLTYTLDKGLSVADVLRSVSQDPAYQGASTVLQVVFEPNSDDHDVILEHLHKTREVLPDVLTVGMTTMGPLGPAMSVPTHTSCTFLAFEDSTAVVRAYDCREQTPAEVGKRFCAELASLANVRGVLCLTADSTLCPGSFAEAICEAYPELPVFGSVAGSHDLHHDGSIVFCDEGLWHRGIVAVALCGAELEVAAQHDLGWLPIGKPLEVQGYVGDGLVSAIDRGPAMSIYRRYLNVGPDEYFVENTCTFPLLSQSGDVLVAHTPLGYTPDGCMQFSTDLQEGTKLHLGYAKPKYLLRAAILSANLLGEHCPQALLLFACVGRRIFLGNKLADREIGYFSHACPTMAWASGFGEIIQTSAGGGVLNNSIVAVVMREGTPAEGPGDFLQDEFLAPKSSVIPLHERLVTFLEATTTELNDTIQNLERLAAHDQLTGIYNRRRMDEIIRYELSKRRKGNDLALLMYDIDHFKQINDTFGHDVGDEVLKGLTQLVAGTIRSGDSLGRWGGEEFLCLLSGTPIEGAQLVAERIRRLVEGHDFGRAGHITISIGVTEATSEDTLESLFIRADKALYEAKNGGRNRVCVQ